MRKYKGKRDKTDKMDRRILTVISHQARITVSDLSKEVGLSATPCGARLERLEADGMILGYYADLDIERLGGVNLYYVTIALKSWTAQAARKLESLLIANPYVVSCDHLFGHLDYWVGMLARSKEHYHDLMRPLEALDIDYTTYPVSRRVIRPRIRQLIARLCLEVE